MSFGSSVVGAQEVSALHRNDDVDADSAAHHHTLGVSPNQAAPGNHKHDTAYAAKVHGHANPSTKARLGAVVPVSFGVSPTLFTIKVKNNNTYITDFDIRLHLNITDRTTIVATDFLIVEWLIDGVLQVEQTAIRWITGTAGNHPTAFRSGVPATIAVDRVAAGAEVTVGIKARVTGAASTSASTYDVEANTYYVLREA